MMSDDNRTTIIDPTFLSRFYLSTSEIYTEKRYLTVIMRTSIFERIFVKYLFKSATKHASLFEYLSYVKSKPKELEIFKSRLNHIIQCFKEEGPLYIFGKIAEEILALLKEDINNVKIDQFILKLEFFFSWHFENNFFEKSSDQIMYMDFYDKMYLQKGRTNFYYSIESLNTIFKFLKIFEKQTLSTKIPDFFEANNSLFCIEKIFYFYCDKLNKDKIPSGNIVDYMLKQLFKKFENLKNSKVINAQIEHYILITLFISNKIIQDYSFYLYKKPELESIFNLVKTLKAWPVPISNFNTDLMETIINESSFQGISLINKLREKFFIDTLSQNVVELKTTPFSTTVLLFTEDWDKTHYDTINSENPKAFNIIRFLERLIEKPKKKQTLIFNLREFLIKLFITFIFNSNQVYSNTTLKKIYDIFYPEYLENAVSPDELIEPLPGKTGTVIEEDDDETKDNKQFEDTKHNLDKLLKLLDVGFDKTIEEFNKEINIVAKKLIDKATGQTTLEEEIEEEKYNILANDYLLPITSMRNYLKPQYIDVQKLTKNYKDKATIVDLFAIYNKNFQYVVKNYFSHLLETHEDVNIEKRIDQLRKQLYHNYRINIVLVEEGRVLNDFIDNVTEGLFNIIENQVSDTDFDEFWKFFVPSKKDIRIHYLLHVLPHFDDYTLNPFKLISPTESLNALQCTLSEFIASNDTLYKNIVYMPWAAKCDSTFFSYIPNCQTKNENKVMEFPVLDTMYSFLKKPLDYYLTDSNGLLNLDLYQFVVVNENSPDNIIRKTFWKNLIITVPDKNETQIKCKFVDYLGLDFKEERNETITISAPFQIRLYNLFFKKNVPFNYNMTSNNGWLEMFLTDRYTKEKVEKCCDYQEFLKKGNKMKFYEEFNVPQMDFKSLFRNYKVKSVEITITRGTPIVFGDDVDEINIGSPMNEKGMFQFKIEEYNRNGEKITVPVASFVSL